MSQRESTFQDDPDVSGKDDGDKKSKSRKPASAYPLSKRRWLEENKDGGKGEDAWDIDIGALHILCEQH
jgi:hypothetical protein